MILDTLSRTKSSRSSVCTLYTIHNASKIIGSVLSSCVHYNIFSHLENIKVTLLVTYAGTREIGYPSTLDGYKAMRLQCINGMIDFQMKLQIWDETKRMIRIFRVASAVEIFLMDDAHGAGWGHCGLECSDITGK